MNTNKQIYSECAVRPSLMYYSKYGAPCLMHLLWFRVREPSLAHIRRYKLHRRKKPYKSPDRADPHPDRVVICQYNLFHLTDMQTQSLHVALQNKSNDFLA